MSNPATRLNSAVLCVTRIKECAIAIAAISKSFGPMSSPLAVKSARTRRIGRQPGHRMARIGSRQEKCAHPQDSWRRCRSDARRTRVLQRPPNIPPHQWDERLRTGRSPRKRSHIGDTGCNGCCPASISRQGVSNFVLALWRSLKRRIGDASSGLLEKGKPCFAGTRQAG